MGLSIHIIGKERFPKTTGGFNVLNDSGVAVQINI
jgi:hypothetical protein